MAIYKKKPCYTEAVQWNGSNLEEIVKFAGSNNLEISGDNECPDIKVRTLQGLAICELGDYILKGIKDFYPCDSEVFESTYEIVEC